MLLLPYREKPAINATLMMRVFSAVWHVLVRVCERQPCHTAASCGGPQPASTHRLLLLGLGGLALLRRLLLGVQLHRVVAQLLQKGCAKGSGEWKVIRERGGGIGGGRGRVRRRGDEGLRALGSGAHSAPPSLPLLPAPQAACACCWAPQRPRGEAGGLAGQPSLAAPPGRPLPALSLPS